MKVSFFMPMIPPTATHQTKEMGVNKKGKAYCYFPPALKEAREKLRSGLYKHSPHEPMTGALRLKTMWMWPYPEKWGEGKRIPTWKVTKPDTDNLLKSLKDIMTELKFWEDDCLVTCEQTEKWWAEPCGIYIEIETLG